MEMGVTCMILDDLDILEELIFYEFRYFFQIF
jgi:hypothetical protein